MVWRGVIRENGPRSQDREARYDITGTQVRPSSPSLPAGGKEYSVIDLRILIRALVVGTVLQVIMVSLAHFIPWVMVHVFEFAGMMISATAGYLYAMDSGKGYFPGATAGAIVGGGCALVGTVLSASLGDVASRVIPFGTAICVLTGAIGGLFGQMAANWRAYENRQR
jgi:hypothetical protein